MSQVNTEQGLVDAINDANADYPNPHTIELTADISLNSVRGSLFGPVGLPVITGVVTINGAGHAIQKTGAPDFRILALNAKTSGNPLASLTLNNVAILDGELSSASSAALVMDGPVTMTDCRVANNVGRGTGGIYVGDGYTLTATRTLFEDNIATGNNARGGVIYNSSGSNLTLFECVFKENKADGSGSRGGAIYRHSGGTVNINDCSFLDNTAPSGAAIYNSSGTMTAEYNWWQAVDGPSGTGGGSGNSIGGLPIDYEPFRTTLPRFTPTSFMATNPSLPLPIASCSISVTQNVNVRRGPSIDDLNIGSDVSPVQITVGQTYDLRAVAIDEESNTWYGFEHPNRLNYLSWVVDTFDSIKYTSISCSQSANFDTQADVTWNNILSLTTCPIDGSMDTSFFPFRGFGMDDPTDYSTIHECAHPGQDFVPLNKSGTKVVSMANGIVVGIGEHNTLKRPALWGTTEGGYNLVVRTGGHFVMYGHLSQVEPHLYLGARVQEGEYLGTVADRGNDTHLHIEIDAFGGATGSVLRSRFGAIIYNGISNPAFVIDPMVFVSIKGSLQNTFNSVPTSCTPTYEYEEYNNGIIGGVSFDYLVRKNLRGNCYNINNGNVITSTPPSTCLSNQP